MEKKKDSRKSQWFRFDDTNVSPFDIKNLPDECFGGFQNNDQSHQNHWMSSDQLKLKNAYMLFYERVEKSSSIRTNATVPSFFQEKISEENAQFIRDQQLFDPEYFNFMYEVMQNTNLEPALQLITSIESNIEFETIKLATYFVFESYVRIKFKSGFIKWMDLLKKFYVNHVPACKWLLNLLITERKSWFRYLLIECYEDYIRSLFGELLFIILKTLGPQEYNFYLEKDSSETLQEMGIPYKSVCVRFMDYFLSCLEFTRQHWRKFTQYFELLRNYILLGTWERKFLSSKEIVGELVDYYMGPYSPNLRVGSTRVRIGETNVPCDLKTFIISLALMVRSQATDGSIKIKQLPPTILDPTVEAIPLSNFDKRMLFDRDFFSNFVKQVHHPASTIEIVSHVAWEDAERSRWFVEILMELVCRSNWDECGGYFSILTSLLQIQDSLIKFRVACIFNLNDGGILHTILYYRKRFPKFATSCVVFVRESLDIFPEVGRFLYAYRKEWWDILDPFLQERILRTKDHNPTSLLKDFSLFVENKLELQYDYSEWKEDFQISTKLSYVQY